MAGDAGAAFSKLMLTLDYPMVIVTTAAADDGERSGCLVGFSTQVSIDPPRYLACISVKNHTHGVIDRATHVAVHFPAEHHQELAELFGGQTGDEVDKFDRCRWSAGPDGVPLLDDVDRWFVGRIADRVPFGDHLGVVVEATQVATRGHEADLTFQEAKDIDPGHSP